MTQTQPTEAAIRELLIADCMAHPNDDCTRAEATACVAHGRLLAAVRRVDRAARGEYDHAVRAAEAELATVPRAEQSARAAAIDARYGVPTLLALLEATTAAVQAVLDAPR